MEKRKLTKADIDKVRNIEGFPIAKDEDIIVLSDPPYYTTCPNPFIADFMQENSKPYDEATDEYHREPFAADVSEGKSDIVYMAHSYHTKVPYKAIMRYIMHYTKPGDIVLDAFCGTGMTGVAAQMCGNTKNSMLMDFSMDNVGARKAVLCDLSPVATNISYNCNRQIDCFKLEDEVTEWIEKCRNRLAWMYQTVHHYEHSLLTQYGTINYTVWSHIVLCPNCGSENVFYDLITTKGKSSKSQKLNCSHCNAEISKSEFVKSTEKKIDLRTGEIIDQIKRVPIKIFYTYSGKRYEKTPDDYDKELLTKIESYSGMWYPTEKMMFKGAAWGEFWRTGYHTGITRVHHFYTKRNIEILAELFSSVGTYEYSSILKEILISSLARASIRNRYIPEYGNKHVGTLSGTLYVPSLFEEDNIIDAVKGRAKKIVKAAAASGNSDKNYIISTGSITALQMQDNIVDYIFTDPPFGNNLIYSELNFISESWLKVFTNSTKESIISNSQNKTIKDYKDLMYQAFVEYYRVLKPNRWITVEFHNSQNSVWNAIREAMQTAGFIIADVRTLDKEKGTTKQLSYSMAVKQDLVISAYKPKDSFRRDFISHAGSEETAWSFVRQHLDKLPVVVVKNDRIELIDERQAYLLYDRMVAYHIMNGISVPLDATDFYKGLDEKFLKRDGMYFLTDQVNEYDTVRIVNDVELIEFQIFVTNEKSAIAWLYQQLVTPQTYAEIQPKFMQEIKTIDKYEAMPELAVLLEDSFLHDDKGRWYIPDRTKETDIAKLREKKLLKEFEGYLATKGKLKLFRTEAIRVGFAKLWANKNYRLIVEIAERLPETIIQEDDKLLMYYDLSLGRI